MTPRRDRSGSTQPRPRAGSGDQPQPGADLVLLGEFGRAHGLRGEIRLKSFTADPAAIASYDPLVTEDGRRMTLTGVRAAPGGQPDLLIARVNGVETREAADALNRVRLYVERNRLPPPEEEDEFLLADLIGLPAVMETGEVLGTVIAVPNYGGGDLLEIAPAEGGASALLPFTRAFVPVVDLPGRRVVVAPPEDLFAPAVETDEAE
jgi:16S rRNA processing protein RimM